MLEIKLVRENLELVKTAMQNRGTAFDWEAFQTQDARRKTILFELEELRRQRNSVSDEVARMKRKGLRAVFARKPFEGNRWPESDFEAFRAEGGVSLERHAQFEALEESLSS